MNCGDYSAMLFVAIFIGMIVGPIGWLLGRSPRDELWTKCVFRGDPPKGFASWGEWVRSPVKSDVTLKTTTEEDCIPDNTISVEYKT